MKRCITIILFLTLAAPFAGSTASASGARPSGEPSGSSGKEDASPIRVNLSELSSDPKRFEGKNIETGGLLIQTSPAYFKPVFMITNGTDKIRVSSWLPLEVAHSPLGLKSEMKKVMSDFLDKYVIISGKVVFDDGKPFIEVKDAKTAE